MFSNYKISFWLNDLNWGYKRAIHINKIIYKEQIYISNIIIIFKNLTITDTCITLIVSHKIHS